jgi:hypothetical protein
MVQYWYNTAVTINYMVKYLQEFHHHQDVLSCFRTRKSTKKVLETLHQQLALDNQEKLESGPVWKNFSAAS